MVHGKKEWKFCVVSRCKACALARAFPKLCVPLTGNGMPALLSELQQVADLPADLFEWRLDCFLATPCPCCLRFGKPGGQAPAVHAAHPGEGGQARLSPEEYERRLVDLLQTGALALWI